MPKKSMLKKAVKKDVSRILAKRNKVSLARVKAPKINKSQGMSPAFELACSMDNPWDCSACVPDGSNGTGCFTIKQQAALTSGTGSCFGFVLNTEPGNLYNLDSGSASATSTYSGGLAAAAQFTSIQNLYKTYRPISAGIRATFTGNTLNDQGVLLLGQLPAGTRLADINATTIGGLADLCSYSTTIPIRNGGQITWRPEDIDDQAAWLPCTYSTATTNTTVLPKPLIIVQAYGVASGGAASVQIEFVLNCEGQYRQQSFLPGGESQSIAKKKIEPGWFEKAKMFLTAARPVLSLAAQSVGTALAGSANPLLSVVGQMANGIANPRAMAVSSRM